VRRKLGFQNERKKEYQPVTDINLGIVPGAGYFAPFGPAPFILLKKGGEYV